MLVNLNNQVFIPQLIQFNSRYNDNFSYNLDLIGFDRNYKKLLDVEKGQQVKISMTKRRGNE
jgi:hypothetical protein